MRDRSFQGVRLHREGVKKFHHPAVGDLTLAYDVLNLSADVGISMTAHTAVPGSPSEDGLKLLASWTATHDQIDAEVHSDGTAV